MDYSHPPDQLSNPATTESRSLEQCLDEVAMVCFALRPSFPEDPTSATSYQDCLLGVNPAVLEELHQIYAEAGGKHGRYLLEHLLPDWKIIRIHLLENHRHQGDQVRLAGFDLTVLDDQFQHLTTLLILRLGLRGGNRGFYLDTWPLPPVAYARVADALKRLIASGAKL